MKLPPARNILHAPVGALFFAFVASLGGSAPAQASKAIVLGDSIGVGVSMAAGVPRLAHNSVSIRSADAISQIQRAPRGSIAFLSLGTNDAVGSIAGVEKGVDRIVDAARSADVHVVWIGPPCVTKAWNTNVMKLDAILKQRLAGQITYVSAADPNLCDRSLRAGDGVHFTMKGYSILWARAREAAGVPIESGGGAVDLGGGEQKKHKHEGRRHAKKRHNPKAGPEPQQAAAEPAPADAH